MDAPQPLMLCRAGRYRLAVPLTAVREVLPLLPIDAPPTLPRPLLGFVQVRGQAWPVLAPTLLFDADATLEAIDIDSHLLVLRGDPVANPCLLVDRVEDVLTPEPAALRPIDAATSHNGAFAAELVLADGIAHLLDVSRLLLDSERQRIAALAAEDARRRREWAA